MSLDRYCHGNQDPHKSLQPIRSSNSRSRLPRDQRSTTESTEIHGKENPNQLPLSVSFRVFSGYQFVMIFLAVVISCKDVVRRPNLVSRTGLNHEPWDAGNTALCVPAEGRQGPGPAGSLGSARVLDHGYGPLSRPGAGPALRRPVHLGRAPCDGSYRTGHPWRLRPGGLDPGTALLHLCAGA